MVTVPARNRIALLLAALAAGCAGVPAVEREAPAPPAPVSRPAEPLVVRKWLALDPVDRRARVPFNANTPFLRYLLDRASPPPEEGRSVRGDLAECLWRAVPAKADGTVEDDVGFWFYGEVEVPKGPAEAVYLAHLDGATVLYVNGAPFVGDLYRLGTGPVPVALRAGPNRLFVAGPRGPWRLRFETWAEGRSPLLREDATLPDRIAGDAPCDLHYSCRILNPSLGWQEFGTAEDRDRMPAPPLWTGKLTGSVDSRFVLKGLEGTPSTCTVGLRPSAKGGEARWEEFVLENRGVLEARRVTFVSRIDGSVQFYGYLPPAVSDLAPEKVGTVLSLHGAGVDALEQARAYSPKPDFRIVAPTNRRPFGFDWQDWGEQDAYEVLDDALRAFGGDPARVFLTGHSMGGHGTWHLAANDPDRWLAIAPSAGWCSFDTYGGGPRPVTDLTPIWRACDGGSRTEDLVANLVDLPILVVHGTADEDVPISEAKQMLARIEEAGGHPLHHFEEGAAHWWDGDPAPGAACVDWPGIFELFRKAEACVASRNRVSVDVHHPFKRAFNYRFVLVVGTKGTDEENRESMELARFHAETWWYRANGNAPVVRDTDLLAREEEFAGRNLILYGNADTNAAWAKVVPGDCPVKARRGRLSVGDWEWTGDGLGAVFAYRREASEDRLVGAFAATGPRGTRLGYGLLPFVSGVGYPDYAVFGEEFLRSGDGGVLAAGWFDHRWALQPGGFAREGGK